MHLNKTDHSQFKRIQGI